jgi:hypothetical protein
MQRVSRRLDKLDEIFNPPRRPLKVFRVLVSGASSPETLGNPTCTRTLRNGTLVEIVDLAASAKHLTVDGLEKFIRSFPIDERGTR